MHRAVGVLIVDESYGLDSTLRAALDQASVLRTLSEADLSRAGTTLPEALVALVTVDAGAAEASADRIEDLRSRYPSLKVAVVFEVLESAAIGRLAAVAVDVFVARTASAAVVCATLLGLAGLAAAAAPAPVVPSAEGLTPREAEILRFLSAGFSNKEVARRLGLSVRTVETHRLNLRRKTQTGRLKDLVALARQLGLAPVTEVGGAARRPAASYAAPFAPPSPLSA